MLTESIEYILSDLRFNVMVPLTFKSTYRKRQTSFPFVSRDSKQRDDRAQHILQCVIVAAKNRQAIRSTAALNHFFCKYLSFAIINLDVLQIKIRPQQLENVVSRDNDAAKNYSTVCSRVDVYFSELRNFPRATFPIDVFFAPFD